MLIELELTGVEAVLAALNTRTERSGSADIPAADINIECVGDSDVLAFFSPTLKADFFAAESLDLAGSVTLRHPELKGPIAIEGDMTGAAVIVATGIGEPMRLESCKIGKFKFTPFEGGMVGLQFQVQWQATGAQVARLYESQKQSVTLTVEPLDKGDA